MTSRKGISLEQRRALRRWAHQQHPKPTQKSCIQWFLDQYAHQISQSTVSESLSNTFAHLDDFSTSSSSSGFRKRAGNWPEIETILFDWQTRIEKRGGVTTGDVLQLKAKQIWLQHPTYKDRPVPEFSTRWLERFKQRYGIKLRTRHGEANSISATAEEEMKALQTIAGEFEDENIYNMDETGLFWKMMPSRGLLSRSQPGIKKDKARISLVFCVNATGTDRFPVWIIGKYKTPQALRGVSVPTMGARWRWNQKAWMNTTIMAEWLQEFYHHVGLNRHILLTMDNFSAHIAAIELSPPPSNVRICWLPPNSTSRFQPLDQGIIQNFKAFYKQQWLEYILESITDHNTLDTGVNLRLAIRWIVRAWNSQVTNTTIYNCFRKSTLLQKPISLSTPILPEGLNDLYEEVIRAGKIQDQMAIANFLNPTGEENQEDMTLNEEAVLDEVLEEHLGLNLPISTDEDDVEGEQRKYTSKEAYDAVQVLINYSEAQSSFSSDYIRWLERLEGAIKSVQDQSKQQQSLNRWIK